ncbi:uncharacterized protein LOC141656921 [Silene latifolia]|uniref:uncharacterized protein LOC141656921 n=1 Tax=Silene latifolia TaxID=37657 RepID=UPI003D771ED9
MSIKEDPLTFTSSSSSSPITFSDTLIDTSNSTNTIGSASGSFQGSDNVLYDGGSGSGGGGDVDFGFMRPDFRQNVLVGTVKYYDRHVFLCYKNPKNWPPRIEAAEFDRLPRLLSAALVSRKSDLIKETRLTICEGRDGTETSNGDVLIFPDMIRYRRLTHFDIDTFVEEVLIKDGEWLPGNPEKLKGSYIFVCCHGSRDRRCGVCGPPLVARFKDEVELRGLQGKVSISPCSHVGGHKYAGNVIIFGCSINGEISGYWYGYVTLEDVPKLLEQHIVKGEIVESLWRGQMGLSEDEQQRAQELRLQNSDGTKSGRNITQHSMKLPEVSAQTCGPRADTNGCHQANGNGRCCQMSPLVGKDDNLDTIVGENKASAGKNANKQLLRNNSQTRAGKRKVCSIPTWFESWERDDTYAALSVVCAAACVGVAYRCYKQL